MRERQAVKPPQGICMKEAKARIHKLLKKVFKSTLIALAVLVAVFVFIAESVPTRIEYFLKALSTKSSDDADYYFCRAKNPHWRLFSPDNCVRRKKVPCPKGQQGPCYETPPEPEREKGKDIRTFGMDSPKPMPGHEPPP